MVNGWNVGFEGNTKFHGKLKFTSCVPLSFILNLL